MATDLSGKTIAILATDGFEQSELTEPKRELEKAGATTTIVSPKAAGEELTAWKFTDWGETFTVDLALDDADAADFDGLVLPGGVMNPDSLRTDTRATHLVRAFFESDKPVAAICHGPWTLAEADVIRGRNLTSYPSIRTDLKNAGAEWRDEEVVVDGNLVTSRKPDDLPAFNRAFIDIMASAGRQ